MDSELLGEKCRDHDRRRPVALGLSEYQAPAHFSRGLSHVQSSMQFVHSRGSKGNSLTPSQAQIAQNVNQRPGPLEELCSERGATGKTLKDRIANLASVITVPQELLDGADVLRLLGNDAAHVEANVFDRIGGQQLAVAVEFAKELLKAVYQLADLLERLEGLKKNSS